MAEGGAGGGGSGMKQGCGSGLRQIREGTKILGKTINESSHTTVT